MSDPSQIRANPPRKLGAHAAQANLGALLEVAEIRGHRTILTRHGRQAAALVSIRDLRRLALIEANPELLRAVEAAEREVSRAA